jgi:hypothetical protein
MYIKQAILVINAQCTTELALAEQIVECYARSNRDTRTELLPSLTAVVHSVDEMLPMGQSYISVT